MRTFFAMPGNERLASHLATLTGGTVEQLELKRFPDRETYVRVLDEVKGKDVFLVCTLADPDPRFLGLTFVARELRELGAKRLSLVAPYLAYMRQDRVFRPGEALTSRFFAECLQVHFDMLITVDPHLHRYFRLDDLYDIRAVAVHTAPLFAEWIRQNVPKPFLIGPDAEAAQWVESIAAVAGIPWTLFSKQRESGRKVRLEAPDLAAFQGRTPVLVDDIVSSGETMVRSIGILRDAGFGRPHCLAVHALCTPAAAKRIREASGGFLTSNSVPNDDAAFDVAPLLADAVIEAAADSAVRKFQGAPRLC